jgi:mono/diheme cytochrome c family protein
MRTIKLTFLLFGVTLLLVLAAACASAQTPAPTPVPPTPTAIQPSTAAPANTEPSSEPTFVPSTAADSGITGASLFDLSCSQCHGLDAAGKTFEDDGNTISPPSLAWSDLSQMYALDTSRGTLEQQLTLAITKGQDETGDELNAMMPRWSSLSQEQVDSVIQYLKTMDTTANAAPTLSPAAADLKGEQLYQQSCAVCHGHDGKGRTFEDDGNTISPPSLAWSDLSEMYSTDPSRGTVEEQFATAVTKGLDESGDALNPMMPRWSFLSQEQVDSLVQYIKTNIK